MRDNGFSPSGLSKVLVIAIIFELFQSDPFVELDIHYKPQVVILNFITKYKTKKIFLIPVGKSYKPLLDALLRLQGYLCHSVSVACPWVV